MSRPAALRAWRAYIESSGRLMAELERRMKATSGLDMGDFNVLLVLSEAEGRRMRMGDLARELAFAPGRLTYRAGTLEKRGWITREASTDDGRVVWAQLTDEGHRMLRKTRPAHARLVDDLMVSHLTAEDAQDLLRIFGALDDRMRGHEEPATAEAVDPR